MKFDWREGNHVELLINGEAFFPAVFEAIDKARHEVLLETFIVFEDKVGLRLKETLIAAARRGVRVELTVDGYGTADLGTRYIREMTEAGVNLHMFDPRPRVLGMRTNLFRRLHRKLVVVDGELGFIGGINFCADHLADFGPMAKQDYAVAVRGPIVCDLHRTCSQLLSHSASEVHSLLPESPDNREAGPARMLLSIRDNERHRNDIEEQYLRALRSARQRLVVANAYFFPGYRLLRELRNAARRGVQVTLILQGQPDMPLVRLCSRLLYNYLLRDGVVIHEYCQRPLHGKVALVDSDWATVGSSNLDPLSLSLNLEANLVIRDPAFNRQLHDHLQQLADAKCKRVTLQRITRGHWWRAPLIFLSFHFLRHFPAIAGWFPAHSPRIKSLQPLEDAGVEPVYEQQEKSS
ncbi:cardiolipin synthase ClsB [Pseudomonas tohonis]|uniref:cardiolipin synthase ClsB n=1 Tax=Pseudomonas tohonis TaxID=2725477 RepID=UPI0021D82A95|nr:cardiolipin synthase ClsB [Pseudomonas tohonis]UXY55766.1 cardiolipin synthase ClsB [Pseudomonas tohonis]